MKKLSFRVANDCGNSALKIVINGHRYEPIPNVVTKVTRFPALGELEYKHFKDNLENRIICSVVSDNVKTADYFYGNYALAQPLDVESIEIGVGGIKFDSEIPYIATNAAIATHAIKSLTDEEEMLVESIEVEVDMVIGIPGAQFKKEVAKKIAKSFMDDRPQIRMHMPGRSIRVDIIYNFVVALSEGQEIPRLLSVLPKGHNLLKEILGEFGEEYGIDLDEIDPSIFAKSKIINCSIGEGTTERGIIDSLEFDPSTISQQGTINGVGLAIDKMLAKFIYENNLTKFSRQHVSKALMNPDDIYHSKVKKDLNHLLALQGNNIRLLLKNDLGNENNTVNFIIVYGGGSISMKETIYDELVTLGKVANCKIIYVPTKYAVILEVLGFEAFLHSPVFRTLKENHLGSNVA